MSATDANGNNDIVYVTALAQYLKLELNESPFYAQAGIPAHQSIQQQLFPDHYTAIAQQAYAPYFSFLLVTPDPNSPDVPVYNFTIITHRGVALSNTSKVPQ